MNVSWMFPDRYLNGAESLFIPILFFSPIASGSRDYLNKFAFYVIPHRVKKKQLPNKLAVQTSKSENN